ncbi:MAG: phenyltransferase domain-containing protein [Thermodesulfobacteriota bacterium]|nr:phenyltransferase domain-containing protein [Thermodesulfobacteriota bacterium]
MQTQPCLRNSLCPLDIEGLGTLIANQQRDTGEIPWHPGGKTDPWDHVEAAIGLDIAGYYEHARRAFEWLAGIQMDDGSWYSSYENGKPKDMTKESNMSSYIAVGVFHYYLITHDRPFLEYIWPTVSAGIDYAIRLQGKAGQIYWARNKKGEIDPMSLLTGSSSIYMSIKCALVLALVLGKDRPEWQSALIRLEDAIRFRPHLFNRSKSRYSMDWFYPVLSGALTGAEAKKRMDKSWNRFVVDKLGVRCVSDRPWITMAETSEFVMALTAMGMENTASRILDWILPRRYEDGSFWCGMTFPDMVIWPEERLTWTNAALLMATDALYHITPASQLFDHSFWAPSHGVQTQMHRFFKEKHPRINIMDAFETRSRNMRI